MTKVVKSSAESNPLPPWLLPVDEHSTLLLLKVQPGASKNAVGEEMGDRLKVRIQAPPVDGAANEALRKWVAKTLGISKGKVRLVQGEKSREKALQISEMTPENIRFLLLKDEK